MSSERSGIRRAAQAGISVSLLFASGCLLTDPIRPLESPNLIPEFTFQQPTTAGILTLQQTQTQLFIASANDPDGDPLVYEWWKDPDTDPLNVKSGIDARTYSASGADFGSGSHVLRVYVNDPQNATISLEWSIQVP